jgi:pimeloyl-ACP methyl ester carboxylesterase
MAGRKVVRHLVQFPLVGLTMLARDRRPTALPDDGRRPIVLVHGAGGGPGNFLPMRRWLARHGRRRTYAVALPDGATVDAMATHLAQVVHEVVAVNRLDAAAKVDLVGHSLGGIVARVALDDAALAARVHTLATIGAPHAGTHAARLVARPPTVELRPDSPLMARLQRQLPWPGPPTRPRLVAFWSRADLLMHPPHTARLDGAENVELDGVTHYDYLLSESVWRHLAAALDC